MFIRLPLHVSVTSLLTMEISDGDATRRENVPVAKPCGGDDGMKERAGATTNIFYIFI